MWETQQRDEKKCSHNDEKVWKQKKLDIEAPALTYHYMTAFQDFQAVYNNDT